MAADPRAAARRRLIRYLARGGSVMRETVGGSIGVRCCGAARNGREFTAEALQRLIEAGCVVDGQQRQVERVDSPGEIFRFQPNEDR
ncbi:MAG: hypothetical protein JWQ97_2924 [Phenylobacterium sp.]|nr:hypothetical protein [Phenylobacterium sp.]